MIKARQIEDTNVHIVELRSGDFEIETKSGKENFTSNTGYRGNSNVNVTDLIAIREVTATSVVSHYGSGSGGVMGIGTHADESARLLAPRYDAVEDEYGDYVKSERWKTLEDEFAYRKFSETWTAIRKTRTLIGDPLPIEYAKVIFDTGNEFVTAQYAIGGDPAIFEYNRSAAVLRIVRDTMQDLGVEEVADRIVGTASGKQWSNSDHSGIRYLSAWGSYMLDDSWDWTKNAHPLRGSLEDMLAKHEAYKAQLNQIIRSKYQLKFGPFDDGDAKQLINAISGDLGKIVHAINRVASKQRTQGELLTAKDLANKLTAKVASFLSDKQINPTK